jgi:hypothetical protein
MSDRFPFCYHCSWISKYLLNYKISDIKLYREQGIGNREQGTGNREQGTGNREQGTGNREQGTGNREQGTGNREDKQVLNH